MYRSTQKGEILFDGQNVGYELKRISVAESVAWSDLSREKQMDMVREKIVRMDEIRDADGAVVSLATILEDFYFSPLASEIALRLFETGVIPRGKQDPSGGNSSAASQGEPSRAA